MNFKNLISLSVDEQSTEQIQGTLAPAVKRALESRRAKAEDAAATELIDVMDQVEYFKQTEKRNIRRLRKQMEENKKTLNKMDRAMAYGQVTGNFLPVLFMLGKVFSHNAGSLGMTAEEIKRQSVVPSDWKIPSESES